MPDFTDSSSSVTQYYPRMKDCLPGAVPVILVRAVEDKLQPVEDFRSVVSFEDRLQGPLRPLGLRRLLLQEGEGGLADGYPVLPVQDHLVQAGTAILNAANG